ncbi:MAG TPA: ABC transporter permease [Jatrophihabitans sp.]|jgi:peptide/nickel transport system permease protein|nr:ABC transporter permease [Jatrophihabitans sp.]
MLRFIARRTALGVFTLWVISVLSFVIIQLPPGDFATSYLARVSANGGAAAGQSAAQIRADYGLDQPLYMQYLKWMNQVLHGNLGMSLQLQRPVADVLSERMLLTAIVALAALVFTWVVAIPIGVYCAVRRYSIGDYALTFLGFLGLAIPNFLLALALMYVAFSWFGWSVGGLYSQQYQTAPWSLAKLLDLSQHLIIPSLILGAAGTAQLMRIMRANLLDELGKPYVVTARAKGLRERQLIRKYPVRVAMNPMASYISILSSQLISGSIIVSVVLSLPTVGPTLLAALQAQDMFLAGAIILLVGALTVVGTLISDLLLMWLDPRIRHAG